MSNKKKIITFAIYIIGLAIVSAFMGSIISLFLQDPIHVEITTDKVLNNMLTSHGLTVIIVIYIGFILMCLYFFIKLGYFGIYKMINREDRAKSGIHGQARFQTAEEMAMNFGQKDGKKSYKAYNFQELDMSDFHGYIVNSFKRNQKFFIEGVKNNHALVVGSTGSGKTTGFISPTIQANANSKYKASMLIYDLKGDLFKMHSKLLEEKGYKVIVINLKDPVRSVRYNPLELIWDMYQDYIVAKREGNTIEETTLIVKISNYISEITTKIIPTASGENKVWSEGSQGIIMGILWGMLEDSENPNYQMTKSKFTFAQLGNILNRQKEELFNFLTDRPKDSMVWVKAGSIIGNDSEKTVSSYLSNTNTSLAPFLEKTIEIVTCKNDFDMASITEGPTAIFIAIDDTSSACHAICSLLTSQVRNYLVQYADSNGGSLKRTFYFLLDEFANLPKIEGFNKWMSTDRSRLLFYCVMLQSTSQLKNIFNQEEAVEILNNCNLQIYMKANEIDSIKYFLSLFGKFTEIQRSANINTQSMQLGEYSGSTSLTAADLVTQDKLQYIELGTIYFIFAGTPPCKATLVPFYDSELQRLGIFKKENYSHIQVNPPVVFLDNLYNLEERREVYLTGEPIEKKQKNSDSQITDITEEEIVDTTQVNTMDFDVMQQLLEKNFSEPTKEVKLDILSEEVKQIIDEEGEDSSDFLNRIKNRTKKKREEF